MQKITTTLSLLFLTLFLSPKVQAQLFQAQSVVVTTANPDSCTDLMIDVTNYMGCINFVVNPTGIVTVNGSTITVRAECTSSPICAGAISFPIVTGNAGNLAPGTYTVEADAYMDNVYVNTVTTTVTIAPCTGSSATSIVNQTNSGAICAGNNTTLSITAFNATSYQWQEYNAPNWVDLTNGGVYAGATTDQLTLSNLPANYDGNQYRCIAIGASNNDTSNVETITVNPLPNVTLNPLTTTICAGETAFISAPAGNGHQWYFNGVVISGATGSSYNASMAGAYNVMLTDANGCADTAATPVNITVNPLPDFSISSSNPNICVGDTVTLIAPAGGSYQWFANGNAISGATSATHNTTIGGSFNVEYTDTNGCTNTADSSIFVLVNNIPQVSLTQSDSSICDGDSLVLLGPSGGSNQWYLDGTPIAGASSTDYTASTAGVYTVEFTDANGCSNISSNDIELTVTICASTADLEDPKWDLFPNPTTGLIYLNQEELEFENLSVYNLSGQLILEQTQLLQNTRIDLTNFPAGLYIVELRSATNNYSLKIRKQ
jgi:hypothetical protein